MLQFNFKSAHIAGSLNTAAQFLSRLKVKVTDNIRLTTRENVHTTPNEVITSSSDVGKEEHFFFTQPDGEDETEKQTHGEKEKPREKAIECVAHEEPFSIKRSIKDFAKIDGNTTSYSINGFKANALMPVEEDVDLVLKILKLRKLGQPHDELLLTADRHLGTTKRLKIVSFSRMDCYSGNTTEKLVMSNTTIFSYQSI